MFVNTLEDCGIDFFAGVPDSLLKDFCAYITDHFPQHNNIITANEGCAIGVASGHYLATGKTALVYMQNSGIGNAINPLLSLADEKVYSIPMVLLIGWRGEPGVHDEPQHLKQGEVTLFLLKSMDIPYIVLSDIEEEAIDQVRNIVQASTSLNKPVAIVVRKNTFESYSLVNKVTNSMPTIREEALKCVAGIIPDYSIIVSTTGKLSRELYEYRDEMNQSHNSDFLTVGSMGHSSSIALGIALSKPERQVFCLDGDGAFIMHMGAISNIGNLSPSNFTHIVFNNGAHESVGAQPTLGFEIDIPAIAKACGYRNAISVETIEEIENAVKRNDISNGPTLIEIKVGINSRKNLGRPKESPKENKIAFMNFVSK